MNSGVRRTLMIAVCLGGVAEMALGGGSGKGGGQQKAVVTLVPSVDGIAPGTPFEVGLQFKIEEGWHIYWQNAGAAGVAPRVTWLLPDGFTVGDLRYPVPRRHTDPSGLIITNILEGQPVLLATITPPAVLKDKKAFLKAKVTYLVCQESCLQEKAELQVELPVRAVSSEIKATNEKLFESARRALPKAESKYVTVRAELDPRDPITGQPFKLVVDLDIAKGHHIQSHTPLNPAFVRADLFVEKTEGFQLQEPVYPEPSFREVKVLGKISEFNGKVTIRVPGEVEERAAGQPIRFGGVFTYQACTEQGQCFPPDAVAFSVKVGKEASAPAKGDVGTGTVDSVSPTPTSGTARSGEPQTVKDSASPPSDLPTSFLGLLGFAFLGGLILNVMPCVLPVISIKILSFVQQSREEPGRVFRLGLTFGAGILASFWVLALIIMILKSAGKELGWGFQLASPLVVIVMMALIFVFGLSLLGVFIITLPGATVTKLSAAEEHEGYFGAFMKGVLGTVLATPCTAPYLGPALGVAFTTTNDKLFAIFTAVALGMASPFVLLTWQPAWLRFLPKPGLWMEHFKQLMGFLLIGTVVWLMYVLGHLIGPDGIVWTVAFLGFLAIAVWILGLQTPLTPVGRRLTAWVVALSLVVFGWWNSYGRAGTIDQMAMEYRASLECPCDMEAPNLSEEDWAKGKIPWQPWFKGRAEKLAAEGYTVYVDYTAVWCATCLANKMATLESDEVRAKMRENCVIPLKADFTNQPPDILDDLHHFKRSGVPLNVIYPAGKPESPILMPEQLVGRTNLVLEKLDDAGPSVICTSSVSALAGDKWSER